MSLPLESRTQIGLVPAVVTPALREWREELPVLTGRQVVLRELHESDATSLFSLLTTDEVSRFTSTPPDTLDGFRAFINWALRQRAVSRYATFAVTLHGFDTAIGIFQLKEIEFGFSTAEWGFAIGSDFWETGVFLDSAELVLQFAFDTLGVHRLEARAAVPNLRGRGALHKLGAVQEGILRRSLSKGDGYLDQALFSIIDEDWRATGRIATDPGPAVH